MSARNFQKQRFKYIWSYLKIWQLKLGGVPIVCLNKSKFFSCAFSEKTYKLNLILNKVNNGGCSSMVERTTVARKTRVRFPLSTLFN